MTLKRMQVTDFRCLHHADLELDPRYTLISGPNASGKTSLLEALYVLGRGRSFRTRRWQQLIRTGAERLLVFGELDLMGRRVPLGVEGSAAGMRARLNGEKAQSLAELAAVFPVQIIDPEVHRLIEEGPALRRRFVDWGVFHVEPNFVVTWQRYRQVLKQRNAALRAAQPRSVVSAWDVELVRYGEQINEARGRYVALLADPARVLGHSLLGMDLALSYRSGWLRTASLKEALEQSWARDVELGSTQVGPQRAELSIRLNGAAVKDRISRGQQKLLAAALLMAQLRVFPTDAAPQPTLLLDDPAAELDTARLMGLIQEVSRETVQLVVTTLQAGFEAFGAPGRRYEIERGEVRAGN
jgi:DNA replication and repair protein RecF